MIRYTNIEKIIVYYPRRQSFRICEISVESVIRDPESNLNCEISLDELKCIDDFDYATPEEAQMQATISGLNMTDKHLPVISHDVLHRMFCNDSQFSMHLFPINAKASCEKSHSVIMSLDMFGHLAND